MPLISDIRVAEFTWLETEGVAYPVSRHIWRIEFKREGDEEWTQVPVTHIAGTPEEKNDRAPVPESQ